MKKIFLLYIAALAIFAFPIILFRKELIAGFKKQKLLPLPEIGKKEEIKKKISDRKVDILPAEKTAREKQEERKEKMGKE